MRGEDWFIMGLLLSYLLAGGIANKTEMENSQNYTHRNMSQ